MAAKNNRPNKKEMADLEKEFASSTKGAWEKARKAKAGGSLDRIDPGKYYARILKGAVAKDKNKHIYIMISGILCSDEDDVVDQTPWNKGYFLSPPKPLTKEQKAQGWKQRTIEDVLAQLAKDLQRIGFKDEFEDEDNDIGFKELAEMVLSLTDDQPMIMLKVVENKRGGDPYINLITDVDPEDPDCPSGNYADNDDESDDDSDDSDDDEDEEEEKPAKKSSAKGKTTSKAPAKKSKKSKDEEEEEDNDEEEDEGSDDDVGDDDDDEPPEDFDDDDEPDEEEEEKPAKKKARPGRSK